MAKKEENANQQAIENEEAVEEKDEKVINKSEELQLKYDELDERYKRVLAEFENFKKRSQKEREGLYNLVLGDIIIEMLPIIDNLENASKVECKDNGYKQGILLVQKQISEFLNKHNVEEIKSVGEIFDPSVHEAVSTVQLEDKQPQEIVQEYRKGYKIGSKVIRHSMVVINQ